MPGLPQIAFLLSIVGLSVSLAGFSGLLAAFRRGSALQPKDIFRLREIPEMSLATGFLALITLALADSTGSASLTIRIAGGAGLLFTIANALMLNERARSMRLPMNRIDGGVALVIDFAVLIAGVSALVLPTAGAFEWLLALMIARPGLAFLLALSDLTPNVAHNETQARSLNGDPEGKRLDAGADQLR